MACKSNISYLTIIVVLIESVESYTLRFPLKTHSVERKINNSEMRRFVFVFGGFALK